MFRIFFAVIIVLALSGCNKDSVNNIQLGTVGENEPITRAEAARMVSLNVYGIEEINSMERKITFKDTDISKWYDKYINAAFCGNLIAGVDSEYFAPEEYLSLRQAQFLLDKLKAENKVKLQYDPEDKDKPIPYNIWVAAFEKDMNTEKLKTVEIKIYADKSQCKKLGDDFFVTDLGVTFYEGYENLSSDKQITAIVNGNTVAALKSINSVEEYDNLEVVESDESYVKVKVPGGTRKFDVNENSAEQGEVIKIKADEERKWVIDNK